MTLRAVSVTSAVSAEQVAIGHDILSLISSAMYVEPMIIYRELIQNSADAVDEAIAAGVLQSGEGRVQLVVDPLHRQIVVRDNGIGVPNADFVRTMCAIGSSPKRGTKARGFRGIGRLVGLGYAQELVLRSRSRLDERVMEATWDARMLRDLLRSRNRAPLDEVVASVVTVTSRDAAPEEPGHFFEVELRKIVRLADDRLLNAPAVERYLSEVAPVPFHPEFSKGAEITAFLQAHGSYPLLDIRVNGSESKLTRPYRDTIAITSAKIARISEVQTIAIPAYDDGSQIAAVAWIAKHEYFGAVPRRLGVRGFRARVGNLQIGDDRALAEAFPEERFSDWAIGEVHVYDERITPNGRRDAFEPSLHLSNLVGHLQNVGKEVGRSARYSSVERRMERGLQTVQTALKEYTRLLRTSPEAYALRDALFADVIVEMDKARKRLVGTDRQRWEAEIADLEKQMEKAKSIKVKHGPHIRERAKGRVDVLKALRSEIPGGLSIATALLKILKDYD
jgi:molecular chaperone HtpG